MNTRLWRWTKNIIFGDKEHPKKQWWFSKRFSSIGVSLSSDHLESLLWSPK